MALLDPLYAVWRKINEVVDPVKLVANGLFWGLYALLLFWIGTLLV